MPIGISSSRSMSREHIRSASFGYKGTKLSAVADVVDVVREGGVAAFPETEIWPSHQHRIGCWTVW